MALDCDSRRRLGVIFGIRGGRRGIVQSRKFVREEVGQWELSASKNIVNRAAGRYTSRPWLFVFKEMFGL